MLKFAAGEADRLGDDHIGTEHLLLGLASEGGSVATTLLAAHGVTLEGLRDELRQ